MSSEPVVKPISPGEIPSEKAKLIPDFVIEAINSLLALNYNPQSGRLVIKRSEIIDEVVKHGDMTRTSFDNGWLNFESLYAQNGWNVVYDSPSIGDNYEAHYTFSPKKPMKTACYCCGRIHNG